MNGRELELKRMFAVTDQEQLIYHAKLIASLTDSWFSEAAALLVADTITAAPLSPHAYTISRGFGYATWHHGSDLLTICYGQPDTLIAKADLTDTERESLLLHARRMVTSGAQVLAIAYMRTAKPPSETVIARETALTFDGCLAFAYKNRV